MVGVDSRLELRMRKADRNRGKADRRRGVIPKSKLTVTVLLRLSSLFVSLPEHFWNVLLRLLLVVICQISKQL